MIFEFKSSLGESSSLEERTSETSWSDMLKKRRMLAASESSSSAAVPSRDYEESKKYGGKK